MAPAKGVSSAGPHNSATSIPIYAVPHKNINGANNMYDLPGMETSANNLYDLTGPSVDSNLYDNMGSTAPSNNLYSHLNRDVNV
eukprot:m.348912 g.348912  ORF g.348912 m.348912 type:complete len:84 (+) comp39551_c0_seq1:328-579(+)